eukprot:jgi/Mesvir1/24603/Mv21920-RA.1
MLAQGTTGITNDEEPNGDSSEEDTDVGEALAGAKEEQAQGFRPPGASTVAGAPGAVFPAVFGHMAPVVGGDGRKQLANAGRSLANAAGASFGGGEGVSAVPRSGTLKAGARGGGKEEKAGLPRSAKGDGAAGMGLSPEMMAQMNALMGGFQQLGIGGAQGLGAAVRVPAPSVQEGGAWGGAGAAGPSPAGWTSGPHGYPGTPTGVERTQGPAYAYPGQMGAAWPQPYPPAGTAYGTWVPAAGTPYHMALAAAQGGQRKRESKRSKCRECGHRHCRCTSSDSTSSDSEGSGRGRAGGRGTGGRLTDLPVTRGVNLLEYLPAGRALSVVWDVEDHKYHQRTAPKHMETAIQGHNGNMVAWLNVQRAPVLRQQKEGTGLGWASKERMELAQNLCHVWDTLNKELSPNVCSELAGVEYLALCVEALLLVETSGSWNASGYMLSLCMSQLVHSIIEGSRHYFLQNTFTHKRLLDQSRIIGE